MWHSMLHRDSLELSSLKTGTKTVCSHDMLKHNTIQKLLQIEPLNPLMCYCDLSSHYQATWNSNMMVCS